MPTTTVTVVIPPNGTLSIMGELYNNDLKI